MTTMPVYMLDACNIFHHVFGTAHRIELFQVPRSLVGCEETESIACGDLPVLSWLAEYSTCGKQYIIFTDT